MKSGIARNLISKIGTFKLKRHLFLVGILVGVLFSLNFASTKNPVQGDVVLNDPTNPTNWQGTFVQSGNPAAFGTDVSVSENQNVAISSNPSGGYQVGLTSAATSGSMRTVNIAPNATTFKAWAQIKVSITQPPGVAVANSKATYDVLCGDQTNNCGGTLFNNPFSGFQNLDPAAGPLDNPAISFSKIRIRISWTRTNTTYASVLLTDWQASWSLTNGISVTIAKTPTSANPAYVGSPPGVGTNSSVSYTLSYSINKSVNNFYLELPFPGGIRSGTNYTVSFLSATGGGSSNGTKVTWNLGSINSGTAGSVTAAFRINIGPPDGTLFKTTATYQANDASSGALIGPLDTGEDTLTISSKAYLLSRLMGPGFVNKSTNVTYPMATNGEIYQSDMYNVQFTFTYSTCTTAATPTATAPAGITVPTVANGGINTTARTVTFNVGNYKWSSGVNKLYTVTVKANTTCSVPITAQWQLTATDQLSTFVQDITKTVTSTFTTSTVPVLSVDKFTWTAGTGPSQRIDYGFRFAMDYSAAVTGFYAIDSIPTQSVFLSAGFNTPVLMANGINPNAANPISVYTSNLASQPSKTDSSWKLLNADGTSFYGTATTFVKWQSGGSGNLYWDKMDNNDWPMGTLSIVTTSSATSGTVANTVKAYGTNVCTSPTGCSDSNSIPVTNQPDFVIYTDPPSPNPASAGASQGVTYRGVVTNWGGSSNGSAKKVVVTMKIPDQQFLDQTTPIISAKAYCPGLSPQDHCVEKDGSLSASNPSFWLDASLPYGCTAGSGISYCRGYDPTAGTITWTIPLIYSANIYPTSYPWYYEFYVKVKTRSGLANNTTANCLNPPIPPGTVVTCNVAATGWNSTETTQDYSKSQNFPSALLIQSNPVLGICKSVSPSTIDYQEYTTYTISYWNTGNGLADNAYIIDNIPQTTNTNPPYLMNYDSTHPATTPNGESFYWRSDIPRSSTKPPVLPLASWTAGLPTAAQQNSVTWVMWKNSVPADPAKNCSNPQYSAGLSVKDGGSPNNTQFQNKASISFLDASNNEITANSNSATATIYNPGFITARGGGSGGGGDIGSVGEIRFNRTLPDNCGTPSVPCYTVDYLGIAKAIYQKNLPKDFNDCCFKSLKGWVVGSNYELAPQINYSLLWPAYSARAVDCADVDACLGPVGQSGGAVRHYSGSCPFDITSATVNIYPSGEPLILFIPCVNGTNGDLKIDTNFTVGSATGVIFVVKGDITVDKGVTNIDGNFLADGQFSSGSIGTTAGNGDAGRYAATEIGTDGFPRIVYMVDNDLRFIRCQDYNCTQKTFNYVATMNSVSSIQFALDSTNVPRIVVGLRDQSDGEVYYIRCLDQDCLTKDAPVKIDDAVDPDIVHNSSDQPWISEGLGLNAPRTATTAFCSSVSCTTIPTPPTRTQIDGDANYDIGDTQIEMDGTTPVITYVKRKIGAPPEALLYMARYVSSGGSGCNSGVTNWICSQITAGTNNIDRYPSMKLISSNVKELYPNTSTKGLSYLSCSAAQCTQATTTNYDLTSLTTGANSCYSASACQVQNYVTMVVPPSSLPQAVFAAKSQTSNRYDIRFAYCSAGTCDASSWTNRTIVAGAGDGVDAARVYSQALALGREASDAIVKYPRIVYYDGVNRDLVYVRCDQEYCATKSTFVLDSGDPITLADVSLTINGSLLACLGQAAGCKINLLRDLFYGSMSAAGENFILQPRYYYLFRNILAKKSLYLESAP